MHTIRYNSARVALEGLGRGGLIEAAYTGPMTATAFDALREDALHLLPDASAFVIRLDRALILMAEEEDPVKQGSFSGNNAAGALIVRPDEYDRWTAYARKAAATGVMRSVWLESHALQAYEWADRLARERTARLRQ